MDERLDAPRRRLNPFAFPAETDLRFVLFALAALAWSANWGALIGGFLDSAATPEKQAATGLATSNFVLWALILPAVVLVAGLVLDLMHPELIIRRQRLQPLGAGGDETLSAEIHRLAATAGLPAAPRIYLRQGKQTGAQAFGRAAPFDLRLDEGLRLLLRKSPAAFRAVVLHELAHIANRDVRRHYLAQGLWTATLWLTVLPFVLFVLGYAVTGPKFAQLLAGDASQLAFFLGRTLPTLLLLVVQLAAGLLMAGAIRGSLLRVRETYADWRAATWGAGDQLAALLQRHTAAEEGPAPSLRDRLAHVLRMHPTPSEQLGALAEPERLFRVTPQLGLLVGWLASTVIFGVVVPFFVSLAALFGGLADPSTTSGGDPLLLIPLFLLALVVLVALLFLPFFLLATGVTRSLGLQVVREAVSRAYEGAPARGLYGRLLRTALLLALGFYLGFMTSFAGTIVFWDILTFLAGALLQLPLLVAMLWACLAAQALFSRRLLATRIGRESPVGDLRLLSSAFGVLLGLPLMLYVAAMFATLFRSGRLAGWSATAAGTPGEQAMLSVVAVQLVLFIILFAGLFLGEWLITSRRRRLGVDRCPACGAIVRDARLNGLCEQCGSELAAWLTLA